MSAGRTIQSVERAIAILEAFNGTEKELSVTELSKKLGLSKSTAFGLINTLAENDYLEQNSENSRYRLGLKLLKMGSLVQKNNIVCQKARPYLDYLAGEFNETVHLAIQRNNLVVYIDKIESSRTIYIHSHVGAENPMYCTGVGKCLLAFMPQEERARIFRNYENLEKRTPKTVVDPVVLQEQLELVRQQGYAVDDEEYGLGLYCLAAPIFNQAGQIVAALSISGPKAHFDAERSALITAQMLDVTKKISFSL